MIGTDIKTHAAQLVKLFSPPVLCLFNSISNISDTNNKKVQEGHLYTLSNSSVVIQMQNMVTKFTLHIVIYSVRYISQEYTDLSLFQIKRENQMHLKG